MQEESEKRQTVTIGRYMLHRQIARGGMATIHIARLMGDEGFSRIVAAKRLHPEFAEDAEFVQMFLDEARIASKVHHRNVVAVLDVVTTGDEAELVGEIMSGSLPTITDALAQEKEWLGANRWKQLETLEPIIKRGLSVDPEARWQNAADMEAALATAVPPASPTGCAAWLKAL